MIVEIIKGGDSEYWYHNCVGERFEVEDRPEPTSSGSHIVIRHVGPSDTLSLTMNDLDDFVNRPDRHGISPANFKEVSNGNDAYDNAMSII